MPGDAHCQFIVGQQLLINGEDIGHFYLADPRQRVQQHRSQANNRRFRAGSTTSNKLADRLEAHWFFDGSGPHPEA